MIVICSTCRAQLAIHHKPDNTLITVAGWEKQEVFPALHTGKHQEMGHRKTITEQTEQQSYANNDITC